MQTDINREWWKMKVYNEVSNYLKYPNTANKQQLHSVLLEYEVIFNRLSNIDDVASLDNMELSMNNY
jgi:hypothetical protein